MNTVVETPEYLIAAKQAGMTEEEREWVVRYISLNPASGTIIPEAGGARKVRVPKERQGKSGGYRLVTYYMDEHSPVFLITVLNKRKQANFSEAQKNATKKSVKDEKKQRRRP